jgi:hypothetical protein
VKVRGCAAADEIVMKRLEKPCAQDRDQQQRNEPQAQDLPRLRIPEEDRLHGRRPRESHQKACPQERPAGNAPRQPFADRGKVLAREVGGKRLLVSRMQLLELGEQLHDRRLCVGVQRGCTGPFSGRSRNHATTALKGRPACPGAFLAVQDDGNVVVLWPGRIASALGHGDKPLNGHPA